MIATNSHCTSTMLQEAKCNFDNNYCIDSQTSALCRFVHCTHPLVALETLCPGKVDIHCETNHFTWFGPSTLQFSIACLSPAHIDSFPSNHNVPCIPLHTQCYVGYNICSRPTLKSYIVKQLRHIWSEDLNAQFSIFPIQNLYGQMVTQRGYHQLLKFLTSVLLQHVWCFDRCHCGDRRLHAIVCLSAIGTASYSPLIQCKLGAVSSCLSHMYFIVLNKLFYTTLSACTSCSPAFHLAGKN